LFPVRLCETSRIYIGLAEIATKMMKDTNRKNILDLGEAELRSWLSDRKIEPYRFGQIMRWVFQRQADSFESMTDLRKDIRQMRDAWFVLPRLQVDRVEASDDGSRKFLFRLSDGDAVESVLIPERGHDTLCISSQVGCAQGCRFCLTARGGFQRNLTRAEILSQIRDVRHQMAHPERLTNIVLMGMGEPLANYRNVVDALGTIMDHHHGLGFSHRRVTLSTAGLVPAIDHLGRDIVVNLAVSLNAVDNRTRDFLMPVNRKYPLEELLAACRRFPLPNRRMITFEYILIRDCNDHPADAEKLAGLLQPIRSKINLIPMNEHAGCEFRSPDESTISAFQRVLLDKNFTAVIRRSKGRDISAACGQLRAQRKSRPEISGRHSSGNDSALI
jgi:23S rRNA (adenine2503-C2)-methyltransferase